MKWNSKLSILASTILLLSTVPFASISHASTIPKNNFLGNGGGFGKPPGGNPSVSSISPNTGITIGGGGGNLPACFGNFQDSAGVATVDIQTGSNSTGATLQYGLFLTPLTEAELGPFVNVSMIEATINSQRINPPFGYYQNYDWNYTFHGSLVYPQYFSGYSGTKQVQVGDVISFGWVITSSTNSNEAWRDFTCQIE